MYQVIRCHYQSPSVLETNWQVVTTVDTGLQVMPIVQLDDSEKLEHDLRNPLAYLTGYGEEWNYEDDQEVAGYQIWKGKTKVRVGYWEGGKILSVTNSVLCTGVLEFYTLQAAENFKANSENYVVTAKNRKSKLSTKQYRIVAVDVYGNAIK